MEQVEREILVPVVHALKRARRPFRGVLYAGLMLTNQGPKVLEFNVRFGDPESQVVLMRLKSDLLDVLDAVVDERLDAVTLEWDRARRSPSSWRPRGTRAITSGTGVIHNLEEADRMPDVKVFHAGTTLRDRRRAGRDGRIVTDGGRVLNVTALGDTLAEAQARAYEAARAIRFTGAWYRRDIAGRTPRSGRRRRRPAPSQPGPGEPRPRRGPIATDGASSVHPRGPESRPASRPARRAGGLTSCSPSRPPAGAPEDSEIAGDVVHLERAFQRRLADVVDGRGDVRLVAARSAGTTGPFLMWTNRAKNAALTGPRWRPADSSNCRRSPRTWVDRPAAGTDRPVREDRAGSGRRRRGPWTGSDRDGRKTELTTLPAIRTVMPPSGGRFNSASGSGRCGGRSRRPVPDENGLDDGEMMVAKFCW